MAEIKLKEESLITFREFLEKVPSNNLRSLKPDGKRYGQSISIEMPELMLYCDSEDCNGIRRFSCDNEVLIETGSYVDLFRDYVCKNCTSNYKKYSLMMNWEKTTNELIAYKYGEHPVFGPPVPDKLKRLLGDELEYFRRGQRAESQGMGIAAFAYYRRVLVNQKNRIFDEILKVCTKLGIQTELVEALENAKNEPRFTQSVESIKPSLPHVLYVDGHDPLTLLHDAISDALHDGTDEECLELATTIRIVLTELVEKIAAVNAEKIELTAAISTLLKRKQGKIK